MLELSKSFELDIQPLDKAVGYAIQAHEHELVAHYHGLHSTVVGLPVEEVGERLMAF